MWEKIESAMSSEFDFRAALAAIFDVVEFANKFITEKKPWELQGEERNKILGILLEILRHLALALQPFIPQTSVKITKSLGMSLEGDLEKLKKWGAVSEFKLTKPPILFPKKK